MALNLANTVTITAKTAYANVTTVSSNVLTNSASSNTIYKINNINLTNYKTTAQTTTVVVNRSGTNYYIANAISIPGNSLLVLLGKDNSIYLEENDTLQIFSSVNSSIHLVSSYELLS